MSEKQPKPKCCNCAHAGQQFKLGKITHVHCFHPKWDKIADAGDLSPWDTLMEFGWTCADHQFKPKKESNDKA